MDRSWDAALSCPPTSPTSIKTPVRVERAVVHYTTGCQGIDLEIDTETGKIEILKAVSVLLTWVKQSTRPGKSQIEGGFIQGMSSAMFEEMKLVNGVMKNPSFVDYRIATTSDLPKENIALFVETAQDDGPWGARGIGEHPMTPTIGVMANAIYDAIGVTGSKPSSDRAEKIYLAMVEARKSLLKCITRMCRLFRHIYYFL